MQFRLARLVIGAGALVVAASSGAAAQEGVPMKGILGSIGIIPKDPPQINYRERAPLVLPPKEALPPPVDRGSVEARAANWPKDPDVAAARKEAAEAKKPWLESEAYKNSEGRRLSVEEMRAGRNPRNRATSVDPNAHGGRADKSRMEPDELRAFDKNETVQLEGNGLERKWLSDPPQELLRAAGNAPLKASQDKVDLRDTESPYAFQRQQQQRN
jgi:hypothetical protein